MRQSNILKMGGLGAILRGRRHRGRHRGGPTSGGQTCSGGAGAVADERRPVSFGHPGTAIEDFYVVSPNVPALPDSLGS
jgi:hypothetical protein